MNEFEAWQKNLDEWEEVDNNEKIKSKIIWFTCKFIIYLLEYYKKHDFILPHKDKNQNEDLKLWIKFHHQIFKHPNGTPREKTEPFIKNNKSKTIRY